MVFASTEKVSTDLDPHNQFVRWVKKQGVRINKVAPSPIPGRGMGIVAQHRIEVGTSTFYPNMSCQINATSP